MKWRSSLTISIFNFNYLPNEDGKKVDAKNKNEYEEIWKNEFDFWILHIKISLYANFNVNLWTENFDPFLGHFSLIEAKMKMNMKNMEKWVQFLNSPYQN